MQGVIGDDDESPRGSARSALEYGAGSDVDEVARDIDEDLEEAYRDALGNFELEKEDLSSGVEDDDSRYSDRVPSHSNSDLDGPIDSCLPGSDECDLSDGEVPNQAMLDKLSRLATQFSRTVEKLRKSVPAASRATVHSDLRHRSKAPSRITPPLVSEEAVACTEEDEDEEFEKDSIASSHSQRKKLLAPWKTISVKKRSNCSEEEAFAEFAEYAQSDLAKAGPYDDVKPRDDDLGGFRKTHVSD